MRILALVTDAYGGRGGIAKVNRDLLAALAAHPGVEEVVALPRVIAEPPEGIPSGVTFRTDTAGSKVRYARALVRELAAGRPYDLLVCGHLHLLPLAAPLARRHRCPMALIVHGVEAWQPPSHPVRRQFMRQAAPYVSVLVSVSRLTLDRLTAWLSLPKAVCHVVPNAVDLSAYGPGPKRADLLAHYGLEGRTVLMTLGRIWSSERYKGYDEILDVMPMLLRDVPDLAYLVCGDGDDRPRLEAKARALGLGDRVVFAGYVSEAEKADHYRLADAFVMPGRGEGFGIVYLEALACGVPVVASSADASREAVLEGELGVVVDPADPENLRHGILEALRERPRGVVPTRLEHFSDTRFRARWHALLDDLFGAHPRSGTTLAGESHRAGSPARFLPCT